METIQETKLSHRTTNGFSEQTRIIILGDFNAQIGSRDLTDIDHQFIGPNLYNDICNDNGEELKQLVHANSLSDKNKWCKSPSVQITWSNNKYHSQIDHILCNSPTIKFRQIFGNRIHLVSTNHKLISTDIYIADDRNEKQFKRNGSPIQPPSAKRQYNLNTSAKWDIQLLAISDYRLKYQTELAIGSRALLSSQLQQTNATTSEPKHL